jgi:hypothetical protein
VAMAHVAASGRGPTLPVPGHVAVAPPHARPRTGRAAALGSDTSAVLAAVDGLA